MNFLPKTNQISKPRKLEPKNSSFLPKRLFPAVATQAFAPKINKLTSKPQTPLSFPGKKVREQWSYMRRKYEEEYFSRKSGNAPTPMDPTKRHLFTFDQLGFLEPYISGMDRSESPLATNGHALELDAIDPQEQGQSGRSSSGVTDTSSPPQEELFGQKANTNLTDLLWQLTNAAAGQSKGEEAGEFWGIKNRRCGVW
jgi:hypothetical protein